MLPILIGEIYKVMLCKKKHVGPWDISKTSEFSQLDFRRQLTKKTITILILIREIYNF